jgi:hypothetical protein
VGRSEGQAALAGGVGEGRDAAVVLVAGPVEHDGLDTRGLGALGDELADLLGLGGLVTLGARRSASIVEAYASVLPTRSSTTWTRCAWRAGDDQARTLGGAGDLLAAAGLTTDGP